MKQLVGISLISGVIFSLLFSSFDAYSLSANYCTLAPQTQIEQLNTPDEIVKPFKSKDLSDFITLLKLKAKNLFHHSEKKNFCFVVSRVGGPDGVSLEVMQRIEMLLNRGHTVTVFTGVAEYTDFLPTIAKLINLGVKVEVCEEASMYKETEEKIAKGLFGKENYDPVKYALLMKKAAIIKEQLMAHLQNYNIDEIFIDNLQLPGNQFSLGLGSVRAVKEFMAKEKRSLPVHYFLHDFPEDREDYWPMASSIKKLVEELTPHFDNFNYFLINKEDLKRLKQKDSSTTIERNIDPAKATVVPNTFNLREKLKPISKKRKAFIKEILGIDEKDTVFLCPVRPVSRKRIDIAIRFMAELKKKGIENAVLVITHPVFDINAIENRPRLEEAAKALGVKLIFAAESDEPESKPKLKKAAKALGVKLIFAAEKIRLAAAKDTGQPRKKHENLKISLWDLYQTGDIVYYLSDLEGWGNALLESIYFRKPVIINNYEVYKKNIQPEAEFDIPSVTIQTPRQAFYSQFPAESTEHDYAEFIMNEQVSGIDERVNEIYDWITYREQHHTWPAQLKKQAHYNLQQAIKYYSHEVVYRKYLSPVLDREKIQQPELTSPSKLLTLFYAAA